MSAYNSSASSASIYGAGTVAALNSSTSLRPRATEASDALLTLRRRNVTTGNSSRSINPPAPVLAVITQTSSARSGATATQEHTAMATEAATTAEAISATCTTTLPIATDDTRKELRARTAPRRHRQKARFDDGPVDPQSGLNGCEIAGLVIGCIIIFVLLVYFSFQCLFCWQAKRTLQDLKMMPNQGPV